ncbi:MAG: phosphate ABC transporter substrate-binding protein [Planctomycetales bacterium]|nr:phosphate ABC transporter substrate-binding protein [Planctomycetales bacterium]
MKFSGMLFCVAATLLVGCNSGGGSADSNRIRIEGSDTMINLAVAWREAYGKVKPDVDIEVSGNGSGIGIKTLAEGDCDLANSSRSMEEEEKELTKKNTGKEPIEHIVGYDALAVYVHPSCPLEEISLEELAEIYGEGGTITNWSALGGDDEEIAVVSRQNSSGTYKYFQQAIMEKRKYRLGTLDQSGSKDVVEFVANTPSAIGYSGMGYNKPGEVKMLKISLKKGEAAIEPNMENVKNGSYPITRPLMCFTAGEPEGVLADYLAWIKGADAQAIVETQGYVPLN